MSTNWYYVESNERIGPVDESEFKDLIHTEKIIGETYVWRKGFENWVQAKSLDELKKYLSSVFIAENDDHSSDMNSKNNEDEDLLNPLDDGSEESEESDESIQFEWGDVLESDQIFILRIGEDRGAQTKEFGPYTLGMIKELVEQKRVNHLTQIFSPGMDNWLFLGNIDYFKSFFKEDISEVDRRESRRCPISARVFLSEQESFFQGVCRDVSIGGAQVLVAGFKGKEGDEIKINMHFNDGSFAFTAKGKVIRSLSRVKGFAMRFIDLSPESINMINSYIENYED